MIKEKTIKPAQIKIGIVLVFVLSAFLALRFGSAELSLKDFLSALLKRPGHETFSIILYSVRLPRVIASILAGVGLSVSGVLLQSVTGNDLAAPNIVGVNSGAGFVMIFLMHFLPQFGFLRPFGAFLGAFAATMIILLICAKTSVLPSGVILAGVAVTAVLNAGISFMSYYDPDILSDYNHFSVGGLGGSETKELLLPAVMIFICLGISVLLSQKIQALTLGDSLAFSLGIKVKQLRFLCLLIASASAAAVVSFAGLLGFVGLIVPHITRKLLGYEVGGLFAFAPVVGATVVLLGDLFGRTVFAPSEIPVGIVMAFIGAPFFLTIILRRGRNASV